MDSNRNNQIAAHYQRSWGVDGKAVQWKLGPMAQLMPDFRILVFAPTKSRKMWTYATCGMSQQPDAPALELHLFSPVATDAHIELLTVITHYHITGAYVGLGHTVNFGRPWLPNSKCDYGLISLPYLDGPPLEWMESDGNKIRFLWLVPLYSKEVEFKKIHGLEELETRLEGSGLDYLDPRRRSAV
jgi:hypothetical protein